MNAEMLFENVNKPEQIVEALRRRDRSYIRGVVQWYTRNPKNKLLVPFLKKALLHFSSGAS